MRPFGEDAGISPAAASAHSIDLASAMVLRGAVGTLVAAAAAPRGREGIWGAAGFVMGTMFDYYGVAATAFAALYQKMGESAGQDGGLTGALTPNGRARCGSCGRARRRGRRGRGRRA